MQLLTCDSQTITFEKETQNSKNKNNISYIYLRAKKNNTPNP